MDDEEAQTHLERIRDLIVDHPHLIAVPCHTFAGNGIAIVNPNPADRVALRYGAALDTYAQVRDHLQGGGGQSELPEAQLLLDQTSSDLESVRDSLAARRVRA